MSVKIRLTRMGKKKNPVYRIVACDSRSPREGKFLDFLGTYSPMSVEDKSVVDKEKALLWLQRGAQPSDVVRRILTKQKIYQHFIQAKQDAKKGPLLK